MRPVLKVLRLEGFDASVALPVYETAGAAGADIRANFPEGDGITLEPGDRSLIPTGFAAHVPEGFEVQIRPRSGLALKRGIALVNAPGTIDTDYRGPIGVILINHGTDPVEILHGDRIAQMVVAPVVQALISEVDSLSDTDRGVGGFGSTGRA